MSVNYSELSGTEYTYLDELQQAVQEYFNDHTWTEDTFRNVERIDCSIQIYFQEALSLSDFRARLIIATRRPIYGTTQQTPVVRLSDSQWQFSYARGTPLVHNLRTFDPLTTVLDYYAYLMLGYDYDTFSAQGGTRFFEQAREIAERAQAAGGQGWSEVSGNPNRSTLITQLLDPRYRRLREAYFTYHFGGLDRFVTETEAARENIIEVLRRLDALFQDVRTSQALDLFFAAKYEELAAVFEGASSGAQAYGILSRIDPSHLSAYNQLVN